MAHANAIFLSLVSGAALVLGLAPGCSNNAAPAEQVAIIWAVSPGTNSPTVCGAGGGDTWTIGDPEGHPIVTATSSSAGVPVSVNCTVSPNSSGFAVTAGHGVDTFASQFRAASDDYNAIMSQALGDRLAEAMAEMFHKKAREACGFGAIVLSPIARSRPAPARWIKAGLRDGPAMAVEPILAQLLLALPALRRDTECGGSRRPCPLHLTQDLWRRRDGLRPRLPPVNAPNRGELRRKRLTWNLSGGGLEP